MPLRRSAATKVMVFQCPCGTRPIRRSPRGQRPLSRTILVLAAVSSTKTSRAGSNIPCSRIQRQRAPGSSTFDLRNPSLPHLPRIGLWHRPASQKRINADSLSHPRPHENPPDPIGAEHALVVAQQIELRARIAHVLHSAGYGTEL